MQLCGGTRSLAGPAVGAGTGLPLGCAAHGRTRCMTCGGHLEVLIWSIEHGCQIRDLCALAANSAHWEVVRWARGNGHEWSASVCAHAAAEGNLEMLRWVREQGCPWNETTCEEAATAGCLEVLQWAYAHGCPIGPGVSAVLLLGGTWRSLSGAMSRAAS